MVELLIWIDKEDGREPVMTVKAHTDHPNGGSGLERPGRNNSPTW